MNIDIAHFQNFWKEQQKHAKHMEREDALRHIVGFIQNHNTCALATGTGDFEFDAIEYKAVGTFTYFVKEIRPMITVEDGITYDNRIYEIHVEVSDPGDGQLVATITGEGFTVGENNVVTGLNFSNSYKSNPVSVQFTGIKTLSGKDIAAEQFSFTLNGEGVNETVTNAAGGAISFNVGEIHISLSGLAVASIVGIVLNAILPGKDKTFAENPNDQLSGSLGKY